LDWESPKVTRIPGSKSASTGGMHEALPREISHRYYPTMDGEGEREVSRGHSRYRHEPTKI